MDHSQKDRQMALELARQVAARGGCAYYVGGYVRDALLGLENKDIDIEVHGITPKCLEEILDGLGERISIGESFGILGATELSLPPRTSTFLEYFLSSFYIMEA